MAAMTSARHESLDSDNNLWSAILEYYSRTSNAQPGPPKDLKSRPQREAVGDILDAVIPTLSKLNHVRRSRIES